MTWITNMPRGDLRPAHVGYSYQDLVTAYVFAESLIHRYTNITVNRKEVEGDRFDDLGFVYNHKRFRRQIKHSSDKDKCLEEKDFIREHSSIRIDLLIRSYILEGAKAADEYRICATWKPPTDANLLDILEPTNVPALVEGGSSKCFKLCGEKVWPRDENPRWSRLANNLSRDEILSFCDRLVIELDLPRASLSLKKPGSLEKALIILLNNRIGIGIYPNHDRTAEDIAARLITLANQARSREASLTPIEIEQNISLRTDYGRIAQAFPLDENIFQERQTLRPILLERALKGINQIVTGPPGAGKSWELTKLAGDLKEAGAIVARHYCYLDPSDEFVERRITTDVFFGNLIGEITDAEKSLRESTPWRFSAGPRELEAILIQANWTAPLD